MSRKLLLAVFIGGLASALVLAAEPPSVPADTLPKDLPLKKVPLGLDERQAPKDNPLTEARVALGRKLFFDPLLSADKTVACASCHRPERGLAGDTEAPRGIRGQALPRRAPTLLNRAYATSLFWDGRTKTLEEQALEPIANPLEMGSSVAEAVKRLQEHLEYRAKFAAAFDDGVTAANLAKALAGFERTLLRGDSPIDHFRRGEHDALTPSQRHGLWLYESKGGCWRCHSGANFSDEKFHNTGVSWTQSPRDPGRQAATGQEADRGKFKTPTLRGVALRGPFMHDGSLKSLQEVVEFYNQGGRSDPNLDADLKPLKLTKDELADLVAFLKAL